MSDSNPSTHRFDHTPFLIKPDGRRVHLTDHDPANTAGIDDKAAAKAALTDDVSKLSDAQERLWASSEWSVLIIFQAMDAGGKDSCIKHVMSGINPQGCDVHSFKAPSEQERMHHFLWRPSRFLPRAGQIAIFNRSYYEEVLVVRVHTDFLKKQRLNHVEQTALQTGKLDALWHDRYDQIKAWEQNLTRNKTLVLKFFLNVSKKEQFKRFMSRLEDPHKHWKFSAADIEERGYWDDYQKAFSEMLAATSTRHAPWYVIPADKKWFTRACVADIITTRIAELNLQFPKPTEAQMSAINDAIIRLESEQS